MLTPDDRLHFETLMKSLREIADVAQQVADAVRDGAESVRGVANRLPESQEKDTLLAFWAKLDAVGTVMAELDT